MRPPPRSGRSGRGSGLLVPTLALALAVGLPGCGEVDRAAAAVPDTLLEVNGTRLFVHREGRGEPVIVVHGGPLLDHGHLTGPLRPLAEDYRLVFFDQRLSGRSEGVVDSASVRLDTLIADIEELRSALELDRIHLLGHSWGGLLAMRYALDHPDRVRSLVLVSPMAPSSELWQREQAELAASVQPEDTAGMGAIRSSEAFRARDPAAIELLLRRSFRGQVADPRVADSLRFHIPADYGERSRQFSFLMQDLGSYDLTGRLPSLDVPTLVIYGAVEPAADPAIDTLQALLPDVRFVRVRDAGHFSFLERPGVFLELVRPFLRQTGAR